MKVYGLYGKSGTGKSHKAFQVLHKYQIEAIIDDGILIINRKKVAGKSAKNEGSLMAATKRAIFFSDSHRDEVKEYLTRHPVDSLLVLGTSMKMITKIAERLGLPDPIHWLPIKLFQSNKELDLARRRRAKNYHAIPIYPASIRSTYFGTWFKQIIIKLGKKTETIVIVRPIYLEKNRIIIEPQCIKDIVNIMAVPAIRIHTTKVDYEMVKLVVSTNSTITIHDLVSWRDHLAQMLYQSLKIKYTVDIQWRSIAVRTSHQGYSAVSKEVAQWITSNIKVQPH
jgi:ABC-type dipeptide/oligopeptide/nickel transport system ATPase component